MASTIRVLVVDDSALIRQMLTRALSMDPRIEIVGTARTGVEAIEKTRELNPDVITLDIEMPELTGLEALPHLRKASDARIVMLSSLDDPDTTYRAMSLGAIDFIPKPTAGMATSLSELTELLLKKIKTAFRVAPGIASEVLRIGAEEAVRTTTERRVASDIAACVGIAASTGGPPALERLFIGLPVSLPASYLVVQHLPQGFAESLAKRLNGVGEIRVSVAEDDMPIRPGRAYLAPYGHHMIVSETDSGPVTRLVDGPPAHGVRPAADLLLDSIARTFGPRAVAVVLTGMGADGAKGALSVKQAGGDVIAQDEETSVVWGMPGSAMRIGAASRVVHVGLIAAEVRRAVRVRSEGVTAGE